MTFEVASTEPFLSIYRGTVTAIDDPLNLYRIQATCPVVYGVDTIDGTAPSSDWAWPMMGAVGMGEGMFFLPRVGDTVWLMFEEGDPDRPVWQHGSWTMRSGVNNVPQHNRGLADNSDSIARDTPDIPASQYQGGLTTKSIKTAAGRIEFDDTDGEERILIEHKSGSRIEILPDGTFLLISSGNKREVITGSDTKVVVGGSSVEHRGPRVETHKGRTIEEQGVYEHIYIEGADYSYKRLDVTAGSEYKTITGTQIIDVIGVAQHSYGGDLAVSVFGNQKKLILDMANWIVANTSMTVPGTAVLLHQANPLLGDIDIKTGSDPTELTNNRLLMRHPIGKLPGIADIVLNAVAMISLTTPLVTLGPLEGVVGKEPLAKGVTLLTYLSTHFHSSPSGPTGIPVVPPPATILSGGGVPALGVWAV